MADPLLRLFGLLFTVSVIAYSIGYFLLQYKGFDSLFAVTAGLEILSYANFLGLAVVAFRAFKLRWLWAILALLLEFALPAAVSIFITSSLNAAHASTPWFYASFVLISLLKLAIAGGVIWLSIHWTKGRVTAGGAVDIRPS
jgi:hypothetical protein